ncbi:unnamed protein product [Musa hybrid cultivar]
MPLRSHARPVRNVDSAFSSCLPPTHHKCLLLHLLFYSRWLCAREKRGMAAAGSGDGRPSRYESQKRRDWNTFLQYLKDHRPPLVLSRCSGAHVLEFLRHLDQFGKTKVHATGCPFFGLPSPPAPCPCPLRQAWGSLDALVGRLRAAFEENGGHPEANPFGARAVRLYLREVRDSQAKARGIAYEKRKKKRKRSPLQPPVAVAEAPRCDLNSLDYDNMDVIQYLVTGTNMETMTGEADTGVVMAIMGTLDAAFMPLPVFH